MKKWIIALFVLAAVGSNSCSEFLDEVPDNRTEIDNMDKVKALLVSAYPTIFHETLEFRCDGIVDHRATYDGTQPDGGFDYIRNAFFWEEYPKIEMDVDDQHYWYGCYSAIASANHALAAIEKMGNPKGCEIWIAEARLCRAYAHFMLLTLFSDFFDENNRSTNPGIPYVTEPEEVVSKHYDRGTVASTLEKIKEDVEYGMKYVGGESDYKQPKFHFSVDAARLLAMRIALYERNYPLVISYASMLVPQPTRFTTTGRKNATDGTDQVLPATDDVAYIYCNNNLFDWITATNTYSGSDAISVAFQRATNSNIILASEPYSYLNRVTTTTAYTRYTYSDETFDEITGSCANGCEWRLPKYLLGSMPAGAPNFVPKFYEDFKITNIQAGTGYVYCRVNLMRREEAILARAEAYAMMGEYDKALVDLTMYCQNRVVTDSPQKAPIRDFCYTRDKVVNFYKEKLELDTHYFKSSFNAGRFTTDIATSDGLVQRSILLAVLDARRAEFLYEGYRWFDILRWNIPVVHRTATGQGSTLTPDDDRRLLQLPSTVTLSGIEVNTYENVPNPWN